MIFNTFIPIGFLVLNLILFTNFFGVHLSLKQAIIIHYISFIALGLAFEIPELSLNSWCVYKARRADTFQSSFLRIKQALSIRYILTHFIAPCSGMTVIASGLFLVYATKGSFQTGWIFWIMVTATIGLYKGIYQHNLFIRRLIHSANENSSPELLRRAIRSPFDQVLIFLECPTYIFNYLIAVYKTPLPNPLAGWISHLEAVSGLKALPGLCIILSGSLLIPILYVCIKSFSRTEALIVPQPLAFTTLKTEAT